MHELKETHKDYSSETAQCKFKINLLENRLDFFERQYRSRNLIIYNLPDTEDTNNDLELTIENLFFKINLALPKFSIEETFRLGTTIGKRPVIVKFNSIRWVKMAFSKLLEFRKLNLSISNDKSIKERDEYKTLLNYKRDLKNAGIEIQIKRNKIIYNSKILSENDIDSLIKNANISQSLVHGVNSAPPPLFSSVAQMTPSRDLKRKKGRPKKDADLENHGDIRMDHYLLKHNENGTPRKSARLMPPLEFPPTSRMEVEKDPLSKENQNVQ